MDNELQVMTTDNIPVENKSVTFQRAGATRQAYIKKVVEMLHAKNTLLDKFGTEHEVDDNVTQLKAAEMISKLIGDNKEDAAPKTYNTVINISPTELATLKDMVAGVQLELSALASNGRQTGEVIDAEIL